MYPYVRAAATLLSSRRKPPLDPFATLVTRHRAWPSDTDIFGELNHGRILTLYELGRWALTARTGVARLLFRDGFGFAVAGVSVRYRRRIPLWSRYEMRTRMLGWDARFYYMDQSMWLGDVAANQLLLRAAFLKKGKSVPPAEIAARVGLGDESPALPDWAANWIEAEATRPWPPEYEATTGRG